MFTQSFHNHTWRCNHATGTEREYVENAVKHGMTVLGFSDHSPYVFEGDYYSGFRMKPDQILVSDNIAVLALVGRHMAFHSGSSGKIFQTLGEKKINVRMISQGPEELNIIIGIEEKDFNEAVLSLYRKFV